MYQTAERDYQVLLTPFAAFTPEGGTHWRATLLEFPTIVEEAFSRAQAIQQIKERIAEMVTYAEVVTLHAPALPVKMNGYQDELTAQGWDDHSLFHGDEDALQLFEEIEQSRNTQMVSEG